VLGQNDLGDCRSQVSCFPCAKVYYDLILTFSQCMDQIWIISISISIHIYYFCGLGNFELLSFSKKNSFLIVVLSGGKLGHLQNFLQYIKYIIVEFTPFIILFLPLPPHLYSSFNRYHFPFTYLCTPYLHHIDLSPQKDDFFDE
jgi:hypothetical protein